MASGSRPARTSTVIGWRSWWFAYLAAVSTASGLYYLLPALGSAGQLLQVITYAMVMWSAVMVILSGVRRHQPSRRRPWLLLAAGQGLTATGEVIFDIQHQLLHSSADIGPPDVFYLTA